MERKWQTVRQQHPQTTRRKYEEWTSRLWSSWVREKKKLATRKIKEVRRKAKRMETKVLSSTSDDPTAAELPSSDLTVAVATTPLKPRQSPRHQLPPPGNDDDDNDSSSMLDIIPETPSPKQNIKARRSSSIFPGPLLPPHSITSASNSPSTPSTSLTPRKRSHHEMTTRTSESQFAGNSAVECFLAKQLKDNLAKGCLSRTAVLNVLKELEMENYLNNEDDSMSIEMMVGTASLITTIT